MKTVKRNYERVALLVLAASLGFGCGHYQVESIRTGAWPASPYEDLKDVGIGFFESTGSGMSPHTQKNLYETLAFALREEGYTTAEAAEVSDLLKKASLPLDRRLTDNEVELFNRSFGGKIFLQGGVQEVRTETLLEDLLQVMVNVSVYDMRTGKKLGEIKVFGKDLEYHTGRETLGISRMVARQLDEMIRNRKEGTTEERAL